MATTILEGSEAKALVEELKASAAATERRLRAAGAKSLEALVDADPPVSDVDEP